MDAEAAADSNVNPSVDEATGAGDQVGGISLDAVIDLLHTLKPYKEAFLNLQNDDIDQLGTLLKMVNENDPKDTANILGLLEGNTLKTALAGITDEFMLMDRLSKALRTQHVKEIVLLGETLGII